MLMARKATGAAGVSGLVPLLPPIHYPGKPLLYSEFKLLPKDMSSRMLFSVLTFNREGRLGQSRNRTD